MSQIEPQAIDLKSNIKSYLRESASITLKGAIPFVIVFLLLNTFLYLLASSSGSSTYPILITDGYYAYNLINFLSYPLFLWATVSICYLKDHNNQMLSFPFHYKPIINGYISFFAFIGFYLALLIIMSLFILLPIYLLSGSSQKESAETVSYAVSFLSTIEKTSGNITQFFLIYFFWVTMRFFTNFNLKESFHYLNKGFSKNYLNIIILLIVIMFISKVISIIPPNSLYSLIYIPYTLFFIAFNYVLMKHIYFNIEPKKEEQKVKATNSIFSTI